MSLAIATASRDDRPSSTIGADSSIASADCPVAFGDPIAQELTQFGDRLVGAGRPVLCVGSDAAASLAAGCELSSVSVILQCFSLFAQALITVLDHAVRPVSTRRMMPVSPS